MKTNPPGLRASMIDAATFLPFFFGDVVKNRYRDNGVVKIGRELDGSYVSNFTVDSVQALRVGVFFKLLNALAL